MIDVDRDDLKMWLDSAITKLVLRKIEEERSNILEDLSEGGTLGADAGETAQNTAVQVGKIMGLDYILQRKFLDD